MENTKHPGGAEKTSAEMLAQLPYEEQVKKAKIKCLNILERSDKTRSQLEEKLKEGGYSQEVISEAVEYVASCGYLDDLRYAKHYIERRGELKSRAQISYELQGKGIDAEVIAQAFEEADPLDAVDTIRRLAQKKHFDYQTAGEEEREKFCRFLTRKGFFYADIKKALT